MHRFKATTERISGVKALLFFKNRIARIHPPLNILAKLHRLLS
jgi:hypothetical protein